MSIGSNSFEEAHVLPERVSPLMSGSQPQEDLQFERPQGDSWEASITNRRTTSLVVFVPSAICLSCTPRPCRLGEKRLDNLFVADHNWPVFSILLNRQVISFRWLIDPDDVCVAEWGPNRRLSLPDVSHRVKNDGP